MRDDLALDDAVAGVDLGELPEPEVLRLRFRDPHFRLQVGRVGDANEVRARADLRAALDRHQLQHAGHAGLDPQIVELAHAELVGGPLEVDVRFLRRQLRLQPFLGHLQPLLRNLEAVLPDRSPASSST